MKKANQALLVVIVFVIILIVLGITYVAFHKRQASKTVIGAPEIFHSAHFPLDVRFFTNQLVVLTVDNTLGFYDTDSQKVTPYSFPEDLFNSIYHFSFAPAKDRAFIIGSKDENGVQTVRYALIDFQKYQLTWFDEQVITTALGQGYRISDITTDSGGDEFLFTIVPEKVGDAVPDRYRLITIDPVTQTIHEIQALSGKNISMRYYNSKENILAYNRETLTGETGVIIHLGNIGEQTIPQITSLATFANDVVFGSYTSEGQLAFSSIASPENVRLTLSPDSNYPLLNPSVVRSVSGTFTAYHVWKPVTRDGIVRVMQADQKIVVEQPVQGSVELFFSPDEKKLLVVTEQANPEGIAPRQGTIVDLTTGKSSNILLPESINSIVEWF